MRWLVMLLCLVASSSWASSVPIYPPPNIGSVSGGWATIGTTTVNGGAAAVEMEARMAGVVARIPATARLGANAASVGLAAIRLNPVGLATSAVLQYLIQVGIEKCADGTWCKRQTSPSSGDVGFNGTRFCNGNGTACGDSAWSACEAVFAQGVANGSWNTSTDKLTSVQMDSSGNSGNCLGTRTPPGQTGWSIGIGSVSSTGSCISGYVKSGSVCVLDPNASRVPTTDADWNKALTYPMPDQVATDLSTAKVPLPLTITPSPNPVTVNLSDPYVDPVTGKRYRDVAVITPNADGKTATLNVVKQEVDAQGNPVQVPNASGVAVNKPPEKQDDPCTGHETRLGCTEQGDIPEAPELKEQKINVAITPDSGWGAGTASCPADFTFSVLGKPMSMTVKPVCDGADGLRPVIIALAWLGAALIVVGAGRKGEE